MVGAVFLEGLFLNFPGALCSDSSLDPETWYSDDLQLQDAAKIFCSFCRYGPNGTDECFDAAIDMERQTGQAFGLWGGRTSRERQAILDEEIEAIDG